MRRDLTIAERDAKGLRGGPEGCSCSTCLREDLDTFVHVRVRELRVGDVLKSMVPVEGLDRCALGEVVELPVVQGSRGGKRVAIVKWEDEDEPRRYDNGGGFMLEWKGWDHQKHLRGERQYRD